MLKKIFLAALVCFSIPVFAQKSWEVVDRSDFADSAIMGSFFENGKVIFWERMQYHSPQTAGVVYWSSISEHAGDCVKNSRKIVALSLYSDRVAEKLLGKVVVDQLPMERTRPGTVGENALSWACLYASGFHQ